MESYMYVQFGFAIVNTLTELSNLLNVLSVR